MLFKFNKRQLLINFAAIIYCLFFYQLSFSQEKGLQLSSSSIDFGRIAAVAYPAKTIEFVNAGKDKLAILLVEKGPNVKVNFQRKFYQPGERGIISVYYDARSTGSFNEEIKVFSNLDNEPQTILIKGTCISIQECFPNIHNLNLRNVMVINKNTQAAVPMAAATLIHNHNTQKPYILKMDKNGQAVKELPIGLYNISTTIAGFEPYNSELFVPKTYPNIIIELTPQQPVPEKIPVIEAPVPTEKPGIIVTSTDLPEDKYVANNIVLLLDVSGSMNGEGKFKLLQQSINNMVMILRPIDYVSVITYSNDSKIVLPGIIGSEKDKILNTIQELTPHGSTHGVKGLNTAYDMATQQFIKGGNNQIILATDGEFSDKDISDEYYQKFISDYTQKGIKLSILGFGINKPAIERMKKMTTSGDGSYIHIESENFVKKALINEIKAMSFMGGK
jgi:Mg-chelatase subunit ChlD